MTENSGCTLDENIRRYYLDTMGVQCWQTLVPGRTAGQPLSATTEPVVVTETALSLGQRVASCRLCDLYRTRRQPIVGRGSQQADLLFVLSAPAPADDEAGELCGGEAGELFRKMLAAIDISIDDVYITTLLKCAVPENHTILPTEMNACGAYLQQQVAQMQPRLIIVLGETAAQCLLQKNQTLDELRETINPVIREWKQTSPYQYEARPVLVSYSPHELLLQTQNKRKAWADLQLLQSLLADQE